MNGGDADERQAPRKGQPPGGRAERVIAAVHAATLELLQERGYDRMEIPEIAERAQVNKTSIYRRWPSKMELMLDVALSRFGAAVPAEDTGSLAGDLTALLGTVAVALTTPLAQSLIRAFITHGVQDVGLQKARAAFWDARFGASGVIVERAIARGELAPGTNPRHLLECAAAPLFYRVLVTGEGVSEGDIGRMVGQACRAFG